MRWADLTGRQRAGIAVLGAIQVSLQVSLAATAWADLARRPAREVNGPKALWALVIAINVVGPLAYLRFGRRR
jgi:hypothetical protein